MSPSRQDDAVERLKAFIGDGGYQPGDKLPPERVLIGSLGLTRATLRKALDSLDREGIIWRHVGKGTFLAGRPDGEASLSNLVQQMTPVKMMRARLAIEPAIAREAAINASREALIRIKQARARARDATNWADYETHDDQLHREIAEATDNILLVTLFDQVNEVRRAVAMNIVVRGTTRPPASHTSFAEHDRLVEAIEARDPAAAQEAMRIHIGSVSARLFGDR
jgi:DNA-binding FadR family transcriptional regulator